MNVHVSAQEAGQNDDMTVGDTSCEGAADCKQRGTTKLACVCEELRECLPPSVPERSVFQFAIKNTKI